MGVHVDTYALALAAQTTSSAPGTSAIVAPLVGLDTYYPSSVLVTSASVPVAASVLASASVREAANVLEAISKKTFAFIIPASLKWIYTDILDFAVHVHG